MCARGVMRTGVVAGDTTTGVDVGCVARVAGAEGETLAVLLGTKGVDVRVCVSVRVRVWVLVLLDGGVVLRLGVTLPVLRLGVTLPVLRLVMPPPVGALPPPLVEGPAPPPPLAEGQGQPVANAGPEDVTVTVTVLAETTGHVTVTGTTFVSEEGVGQDGLPPPV
jgi:hypothetical protein